VCVCLCEEGVCLCMSVCMRVPCAPSIRIVFVYSSHVLQCVAVRCSVLMCMCEEHAQVIVRLLDAACVCAQCV